MTRTSGGTGAGRALRALLALGVAAGLGLGPAAGTQAQGAERAAGSYGATTGVGVHNAYEKGSYPYFADALDSGAAMLELDVWTNAFGPSWRVSHDNPVGNDNNCENASSPAELRTKARDQDLGGCLADMRAWHEAQPGHRPVLIKMELKDGFQGRHGRGPGDLDALLSAKLGDALYRPGDLAGGHATLDDAVRAEGWPEREALAGKFVVELIPGTVEEGNPADSLWTDREYATHLRDLAAAGRLGEAGAFPAVHTAESGDPRGRYEDASLRPWFVVFDGDASAYANGPIDTGWYARHGYLLVMTDAHNVPPAIDGVNPPESAARDRVVELAGRHASVVSSDWYPLPRVLAMVVGRGTAS
ncbi:phosphatidylinositol-specific phospholipase C domain-containing protein [Streptomyces luteolus]|uniref:Phosphatidylinositol-specific phospholipase C domain-containing protein n=1 Tax=Streptomyces luteolus TaxID=3043615 RepID=A0ABT6T159_9ACTN|nr:phosphatidylinositol-specific phospholipase C domain-containing protein [Streptomyces sp. B-S-A12]MDI3421582.1 phosphatidylinositol-specific phospholipase C domain-containing protein [Streptomyces sp. B-S-A12]